MRSWIWWKSVKFVKIGSTKEARPPGIWPKNLTRGQDLADFWNLPRVCRRGDGNAWNWLIHKSHRCIFPFEKQKWINPFLLLTSFSQLLIDNFGDIEQSFMLMKKNYWWEKVIEYILILPLLSTALHKGTITKRNFHPSGLFDDWGNGARRLLTVRKEQASTFQDADLATTVADMFIEPYG